MGYLRKSRARSLPLAALITCGLLLPGCGDDGGGSNFDVSDPDINQLPFCEILAAFVDLANQEVVVQVAVSDPDQLGQDIGIEVSIEVITAAGVFANDITSASTGNLIVGNTAFGVAYSNFQPGVSTTFRVDSASPQLMMNDPSAVARVTVRDALGGASTCELTFNLNLLTEPTCSIAAPAGVLAGGNVVVDLTVSDNQGDQADLNAFWSIGAGALNPATLVATTAGALGVTASCHTGHTGGLLNGIVNIPTVLGGAPAALSITWDSVADGVALAALQDVTFTIFVEDCTTVAIGGLFNAPCTLNFPVLNNGAPSCVVVAPGAGVSVGGTSTVTIDYTTMDADSANVAATIRWSTDGGATFSLATAAAGFTNPQTAAPGAQSFGWDVPADIATASLPVDVIVRIACDDLTGRPTLPVCDGGEFTLVPISEPACAVTAPAAGVCVDVFPAGILALVFDLTDSQGDPIRFSVCYDVGGGNLPATLTGTSSGALAAYVPANAAACAGAANQVTGASAGATTVMWDAMADMLGQMVCDTVTVTIFPEDGTTAGAGPFFTCNQAFSVSDNGAPSCSVASVTDAEVTYTATDADTAMVSVLFQFSTTGAGGPFASMTPSAGTNPRMVAPGAGLVFPWAGNTDVPTCSPGVIVRVTVDDGVMLANRPATCASAPTDVNCVPVLASCRTLGEGVALGTVVTPPTGVVPVFVIGGLGGLPPPGGDISGIRGSGTNSWAFDYANVNQGEFDGTVQLTDQGGNAMGNPVILFSAGHDYSSLMDGGQCNPVDTFQMVIEGDLDGTLLDFAANMTPAAGGTTATVTTTWMTSAAGNVSISAGGLLTAVAENACATITWSLSSSDPLALIVDATCAGPFSFVACVDSAGIDTATRTTWLPVGDLDGNCAGLPSGRPIGGGVGGRTAFTWLVNSGASGVSAYAVRSEFNGLVLTADCTEDNMSIGASTRDGIDPFAVNCMADAFATLEPDAVRWSGIDAMGINSGIFDLSSQTFMHVSAGSTTVHLNNTALADSSACEIWINNPCMPFNSFAPCMSPPMGGYFTIAGTATVVIP